MAYVRWYHICLERLKQTTNHVKTDNAPIEIQTQYLSNTCVQRYRYTKLIGNRKQNIVSIRTGKGADLKRTKTINNNYQQQELSITRSINNNTRIFRYRLSPGISEHALVYVFLRSKYRKISDSVRTRNND